MSRSVVPLGQLARRLPVAGRIRIGVRKGKAMAALDSFRFTSQDRAALDQVATIYGGTVKPWSDPKAAAGQFEVITDANEIRVALPPDALGGSPNYELWTGGGRARNCDGETCEMLVQGSDGIEPQECPCICWAKGALECRLITRLSVLLPEVRFLGTWRIDTKSQNAAEELPAMVDLIRGVQDRGIVRAVLRIEARTQMTAGTRHNFNVPVLGLDESVDALAAGMAQVGSLGPVAAVPELGAGSNLDDEVVDAEIMNDEPHTISTENVERMRKACTDAGVQVEDVVLIATNSRTTDPAELLTTEIASARDALRSITEAPASGGTEGESPHGPELEPDPALVSVGPETGEGAAVPASSPASGGNGKGAKRG